MTGQRCDPRACETEKTVGRDGTYGAANSLRLWECPVGLFRSFFCFCDELRR